MERNEVSLFLARGAYAEVALNKEVDWSTVKESAYVTRPENGSIPKGVLTFPEGGLGPIRSTPRNQPPVQIESEESEEDDDSDGTRCPKTIQVVEEVLAPIEVQNRNTEVGKTSRGRTSNR